METINQTQYRIGVKSFVYNDVNYSVALTPELCPEDDGLDFTGRYLGILVSSDNGTSRFELEPDHHYKWVSEPEGMDFGLIDILDGMISEIRNPKSTILQESLL